MKMLSKIEDAFSGDVYDILGKPQGEPEVLETIYRTDKYWIVEVNPQAIGKGTQGGHEFCLRMGLIGEHDTLGTGWGDTRQEAYNSMLAEYGELKNKYK